jgi:hypothetical protein
VNLICNHLHWFRSRVNSQGNGLIRHVETCPDFFVTARVHTTKSTIKILAANTNCKYILKIAEITRFSVRGTACTRGLYNLSLRLNTAVTSQRYVTCSARGGQFSKGLAGYNIGNVQQFLKNTVYTEGWSLLCWPFHGSALHGDRCTASFEDHMNVTMNQYAWCSITFAIKGSYQLCGPLYDIMFHLSSEIHAWEFLYDLSAVGGSYQLH